MNTDLELYRVMLLRSMAMQAVGVTDGEDALLAKMDRTWIAMSIAERNAAREFAATLDGAEEFAGGPANNPSVTFTSNRISLAPASGPAVIAGSIGQWTLTALSSFDVFGGMRLTREGGFTAFRPNPRQSCSQAA